MHSRKMVSKNGVLQPDQGYCKAMEKQKVEMSFHLMFQRSIVAYKTCMMTKVIQADPKLTEMRPRDYITNV